MSEIHSLPTTKFKPWLETATAALPDAAAERHLDCVLRRTARKFNLDDDNRDELAAFLRHEMIASAVSWQPGAASLATYQSRAIDYAAIRWKKGYFAEAGARPLMAAGTPIGYQNSADDTEFSAADRWVYDQEQEAATDDAGYEAPRQALKSYRYHLKLIDFRAFRALLTPLQDRIVAEHLRGATLEEIRQALGLSIRRFYAEWGKLRRVARWFYLDNPEA